MTLPGKKPAKGSAATPALEVRDLTFTYPGGAAPVLDRASLVVPDGAFALLTGATGSGKSTLLRLAKPEIAPAGECAGEVLAFGADVRSFSPAESASAVGYVFQSPDNQIVCDTVWHEMAFGLENLGVPADEMRRRVAETCNFFGMGPWLRAQTSELSGGQRQTLALAATLAMRPRLLLLDEPTSMLDPIAEKAFLGFSSARTVSSASPSWWPRTRRRRWPSTPPAPSRWGREACVRWSFLRSPSPGRWPRCPRERRPQAPSPSTCARRGFATTATATGCFVALTFASFKEKCVRSWAATAPASRRCFRSRLASPEPRRAA